MPTSIRRTHGAATNAANQSHREIGSDSACLSTMQPRGYRAAGQETVGTCTGHAAHGRWRGLPRDRLRLAERVLQCFHGRREILGDGLPDLIAIDVVVGVNEAVPHPDDGRPRDAG